MKIIVLAGGLSTERNVALTSGTGICRALRRRGHRAVLVDMFLGLESYTGKIEDIFDAPDGLCADHSVSSDAPDLEAVRRSRRDQSPSMLGQGVLQVCAMADLVFLALHGSCGEDGRIQATLDLLGVPYTGSNYVSSGMAMDKAITKRFMDAEGIRTAPWHDVRYTEADIPALVEKLETPCAVKIVNGRQLHRRGAAGHQGGAGGCPAPYAPIWRPCGGGKENQGPGDPGGCFGRCLSSCCGDYPQECVFRL